MPLPMVEIPGVPTNDQVKPGMAFFAGTGPWDKRCGDCALRGYHYPGPERWSAEQNTFVSRTYKSQGCAMFKKMTGNRGPAVDEMWPSCKYFEQKPKP
jgi:hypothetical protein